MSEATFSPSEVKTEDQPRFLQAAMRTKAFYEAQDPDFDYDAAMRAGRVLAQRAHALDFAKMVDSLAVIVPVNMAELEDTIAQSTAPEAIVDIYRELYPEALAALEGAPHA